MRFTQIQNNGLVQEVFTFRLTEHLKLVLDTYRLQSRQTTRHGWKSIKWYQRNMLRDSTITFNEISIPPEFIEKTKQEIFNTIKFDND